MLNTRDEALALLRRYNKEPFHLQHALTVEGVMRWYANELGYGQEADFWAMVGLLHDIDFEQWPEEHCKKAPELLAEIGAFLKCSSGYFSKSMSWSSPHSPQKSASSPRPISFAYQRITASTVSPWRM